MSLGIQAAWRARAYTSTVKGLSPISRDLRHLASPLGTDCIRHASSASLEKASGSNTKPRRTEPATENVITSSRSALRRAILSRIIKQRGTFDADSSTTASALVKVEATYPSKHAVTSSRRKNTKSLARQDLWAHARRVGDKPATDYRAVVDFLYKFTPPFGTIYDLKITIKREAATGVRELLPEYISSVQNLMLGSQCNIRFDQPNEDGSLGINLSGSEHGVRRTLVELLKAVPKVKAVRVMDSDSRGMLLDLWQRSENKLAPIPLLEAGQIAPPNSHVLTLHRDYSFRATGLVKAQNYTLYHRADRIPRPSVWTQTSMESYVASLVYGVIPPHLVNNLYKGGPDHQQTVVGLLVDLFQSEEARPALTTRTLAMALAYIQDKKLSFRPAARSIFNQSEIYNIPMDTKICNLLLKGSSRSGDLDGFFTVLKMMARKGYCPDSETWLLLLHLVEDVRAKGMILSRMEKLDLNRIQSTLVKVGRHMAPYKLDSMLRKAAFKSGLKSGSIRAFVGDLDAVYSQDWLDVVTYNRMLDVLGRHGARELVSELLDMVQETRRIKPDIISLNSIITHNRSISEIIATLGNFQSHWPAAKLEEDTYHMLFRIAWKRRDPNMLRVIWRYACLALQSSSKMRHQLEGLLQKSREPCSKPLLQDWIDMILGEEALSALRSQHGHNVRVVQVAKWYGSQASRLQPECTFASKLAEAYEKDQIIHSELKGKKKIEDSLRQPLTVEIPLEPRKGFIQRIHVPNKRDAAHSG
ncbi:hypothetical protein BX600DRAFT_509610 [Xylariales sp. PMI_506]|nr:hypothetical protein BX600DRAFT_509610 [Xylariales sp. PMI_506]